jgi:hypothetical protein
VTFSNEPHPLNQAGNSALGPNLNLGPNGNQPSGAGTPPAAYGTPAVNGGNFGVPSGAAFGGPGTSGAAAASLNPSGAGLSGAPAGAGSTTTPGALPGSN